MKQLLTLSLILISVACFGQKKENHLSFKFDALNKAKIIEANNAAVYARKADSVKWKLVTDYLTVMKIDFAFISDKGDSLKVTPEGIELKLRTKPRNNTTTSTQ